MKKLLLIILIFVFVLLLASCTEEAETTAETTTSAPTVTTTVPVTTTPLDGDDPMAAYEYVSKQMSTLKGFEADLVEEQNLGFSSTEQEMSVKINVLDGKKGVISTQLSDADTGTSYAIDMTYIDGTVYCLMKTQGVNMKYKTKEASVVQSFANLFEELDEKEDKNDLDSVAFSKREDGTCLFHVSFTDAAALEILLKQFKELGYDATAFSNVSYTMEFVCNPDGYVISTKAKLFFSMNGMACSVLSDCTYKNIGTVPEITLPADADSYADADAME